MNANYERCLAEVLKHEGGWADHPQDPGGATMKGVTIATFAAFKGRNVTKAELRAISDADLRAIYRTGYWDKIKGDDLPAGLDLVAFDGAVNSGPSRGARWLQLGLGVSGDGVIGPQTLAFAQAANVTQTIDRACDARLAFLRGLRTWKTFGNGWTRRVEAVRSAAKSMAMHTVVVAEIPAATAPQAPPAILPPAMGLNWLERLVAALLAMFGKGK